MENKETSSGKINKLAKPQRFNPQPKQKWQTAKPVRAQRRPQGRG